MSAPITALEDAELDLIMERLRHSKKIRRAVSASASSETLPAGTPSLTRGGRTNAVPITNGSNNESARRRAAKNAYQRLWRKQREAELKQERAQVSQAPDQERQGRNDDFSSSGTDGESDEDDSLSGTGSDTGSGSGSSSGSDSESDSDAPLHPDARFATLEQARNAPVNVSA